MDPLFLDQVERVLNAVDRARPHDSGAASADEKLLAALSYLVYDLIPLDPGRPEFRQGSTLGRQRKHWCRAKFGNGRFRLFFRFRTDARIIVYTWVNDTSTLRTYGSRTDAYAVFGRMLDRGDPPDDWESLLQRASSDEAIARAGALGRRLHKPSE
ncbi:MAG TPA: type II toxin-antitoxin system YhaV family toxin [Longimicrobium sp.]|jgi:toxin YhaV|nr:type II toxin-antitoxin system YhaV family toxin [Longimicrobium sp.]